MAFLRAKPIGVMGMIDQGEQDDKVSVITHFRVASGAVRDCCLSDSPNNATFHACPGLTVTYTCLES